MSIMLLIAPCKLSPDRKVPGSPMEEDVESEVLGDVIPGWVTSGGATTEILASG